MCDWDEHDYAEYLLWTEAAKARAIARGSRESHRERGVVDWARSASTPEGLIDPVS